MIPPSATRVTCSPPASCSTQTSRRSLTCRSAYGAGRTRFARCSAAPPRSSPSTTSGLSAALTWTSTCRRSSLSRRDPSSPPSRRPAHADYPHLPAHARTRTHTHSPPTHRGRNTCRPGIPSHQRSPAATSTFATALPARRALSTRVVVGRLTLTLNLTPDSEPNPHPDANQYCNEPFPTKVLTYDHVVPVSKVRVRARARVRVRVS